MKILLMIACVLLATQIIFAQIYWDENGNITKTMEVISKSSTTTIDTGYNFVDTLRFPLGFKPRPGQFSKDGLEYYLSIEVNSIKQLLYVLRRSALGQPFGEPLLLTGSINDTTFRNGQPSISSDRKSIVFVRSTENSWTSNDLYLATRSDTSLPFESVRALTEINSPDTGEAYPWISTDGLRLYFSKGISGENKLYVSTRLSTNETFGSPQILNINYSEINMFAGWLSNDERELYFTNGQSGDSAMYAVRSNSTSDFPAPTLIQSLSTLGFVSGISLAGEELYLYNSVFPRAAILMFKYTITSVEPDITNIPIGFALEQNYPNPFNPTTMIRYSIPNVISSEGRNLNVVLKVYDVLGNEVATLVNEQKPAGSYEVDFNVAHESLRASGVSASGVYFYQLKVGTLIQTRKMLFLK
ncbi:MAG: T9SS type A sorting domain-containing protein [Ignavibacteria bacterium]|nr:T9SS type A sorting domain-containing protein [Ignavibacteria bacterium]